MKKKVVVISFIFIFVIAVGILFFLEADNDGFLDGDEEVSLAQSFPSAANEKIVVKKIEPSVDVREIPVEDLDLISWDKDRYKMFFKTSYFEQEVLYDHKKVSSVALSPSKNLIAIGIYSNDESSDELSLIIYDIHTKTSWEIHHSLEGPWEVESDPKWVGDGYLFFFQHCGTDCRGLALLDVSTKKEHTASIFGSTWQGEKGGLYSVFFDSPKNKVVKLYGYVDDVNRKMKNGLAYLVFEMSDGKDKSLGEKWFLFNGSSLKLQNSAHSG